MTLNELIEQLTALQEELGNEDPEVRLAIQPQWAFEHSIDQVVLPNRPRIITASEFEAMSEEEQERANEAADRDEVTFLDDGEQAPDRVIYIGEGRQVGYLPGEASRALGWR